MVDIQELIYQDVIKKIADWKEEGIYALSFFIRVNEVVDYEGFPNVCDFSISYNTEADCGEADPDSEERWNYSFWRQNEEPIIDVENDNECTKQLFVWYRENDITNIGFDTEDCYTNDGEYIGKGPVGEYELFELVSDVAVRIQSEGILKKKLGKPIPIIIHDLEYSWFSIQATKKANPNGEADDFIKSMTEEE